MVRKVKFEKFILDVDKFVCNKFGFAEFLSENYMELKISAEHVLDVGSGVGPISIYLGDKGMKVDAIDINPLAVELCMKNIEMNNQIENISVRNVDFTTTKFDKKYDLIISNPPIDVLQEEVMNEEISKKITKKNIDVKLFSFMTNSWKDANGIDLVENIFIRAKKILKEKGKIVLIFGDIDNKNSEYVKQCAAKYGLNIETHKVGSIRGENLGLPRRYETILGHIIIFKF